MKTAENLRVRRMVLVRPVCRPGPPCAARLLSPCPGACPSTWHCLPCTWLAPCWGPSGAPSASWCLWRWLPSVCRCWPVSGRPLCHLWQDRRLCAGLHSGCTHHRVDLQALGRKFWSLCVAMVVGCAVCYVLGTIWFMTLTGSRPCQRPGLVRPALPARRRH